MDDRFSAVASIHLADMNLMIDKTSKGERGGGGGGQGVQMDGR